MSDPPVYAFLIINVFSSNSASFPTPKTCVWFHIICLTKDKWSKDLLEFFKAFGKRVWNINFTDTKTCIAREDGAYKPYYELDSIVGDCDTTIKFFNEIDRLQRFKSLYIFNF